MKINEIDQHSRKLIKQIQRSFISFTINPNTYLHLISLLENSKAVGDQDVILEINLIEQRLKENLVKLLLQDIK